MKLFFWKIREDQIFSRCDQIRRKLWIWSHLLNKSLMENFIFCAVPSTDLSFFKSRIHLPYVWGFVFKFSYSYFIQEENKHEMDMWRAYIWTSRTSNAQFSYAFSKLTIKTKLKIKFVFNFEHISHLVLVFLLLTLNK